MRDLIFGSQAAGFPLTLIWVANARSPLAQSSLRNSKEKSERRYFPVNESSMNVATLVSSAFVGTHMRVHVHTHTHTHTQNHNTSNSTHLFWPSLLYLSSHFTHYFLIITDYYLSSKI